MLFSIGIILLVVSWLSLFFIWIWNFYSILRLDVMPINSPNNNISTTRVHELIHQAKIYFDISNINVVYAKTDKVSILKAYSKTKNTLTIPKISFNSVGYEIDWIIGYIWFTSKLINKNNQFRFLKFIFNILTKIILNIILICSLIAIIFIFFGFYNSQFYKSNPSMVFIFSKQIFPLIVAFLTLIYFLLVVAPVNIKENIETAYDKEIAKFINDFLIDYKEDVVTARFFNHQVKQLYSPTFFSLNKNNEYKYTGVFNIH